MASIAHRPKYMQYYEYKKNIFTDCEMKRIATFVYYNFLYLILVTMNFGKQKTLKK